jgi:hypothetical protein
MMTKCVKNKSLVFVFDLDKTIGYFTQIAIFVEGIENYLKRKLSKKELYKIFDIFPEIFRPDIMSIFKYIKNIKLKLKCVKVMIYTNNMGPKSWVYDIKNYIESKLKYKLFDRTIAAWKVDNKIYEKNRTTHEKTVKDLLKCGNIKSNANIVFLDDINHPYMRDKSVKYIKVRAYKHDIKFELMSNRFLKTPIGKLIKKSEHEKFKKNMLEFSRDDPLGFKYSVSNISSRKNYKKEILGQIKSFVKENKHNISRKKRRKRKNQTKKKGGFLSHFL